MDLKTKRTELQAMVNQAKALYAELEQKGDKATADERQKLNNLIEAGEAKRAELQKLEGLDALDQYANQPATEAKAREQVPTGAKQRKSWGQTVVESPEFKGNDRREMRPVDVKALYASDDAQGGFLVQTQREPEIIDVVRQRPRTVLSLINQSRTTVDAVEYVLFNSRTNNAAPVPERMGGNFGLKPESNLGLDLKTAPVKTIPTWIAASRQILADAPRLRDMVDGELTYMVEEELEDQVIAGDGTGSNFTGILNTAGIQTRAMHATTPTGRGQTTSDTKVDTLRRALTDVQLEFYAPDGIVLNPADAESIELHKNAQGSYTNVYDPVAQRIWRVPVVETPAIPALNGLVGAFRLGATAWDRMQTEIRVGEPNDFFLRNAVAILAELRAAFAVTRPKAFEKVTFI